MGNKNAKGRPTKLTPKLQDDICLRLRAGNTRVASVESCGVRYQSFLNWLERGKEAGAGLYFEFFEAVKKAEADAEVVKVAIISKAANENWTAAAWWLERRSPQDWGRRDRHEISGVNGAPIQHQVSKFTEAADKIYGDSEE